VQLGPYYAWRKEPRTFGQIITGAARRIAATWKPAIQACVFASFLPVAAVATFVILFIPAILSTFIPMFVVRSLPLLFFLTTLCINELAWGRTPSDRPWGELFIAFKGAISRVFVDELLITCLYNVRLVFGDHKVLSAIAHIVIFFIMLRIFATSLTVQFEDRQLFDCFLRTWKLTGDPHWGLAFRRVLATGVIGALLMFLTIALGLVVWLFGWVGIHGASHTSVQPAPKSPLLPVTIWIMVVPLFAFASVIIRYLLVQIYIDLRVRRGEWEPQIPNEVPNIELVPQA
jgi:hypothetical protein